MYQTSLTLDPWLKYSFYLAIGVTRLFGALNFSFNYKTKKFILQTRYQKIYCGIIHLAYSLILPFAITSPYINEAAYKKKHFFILLNHAITVLRLPAILLTLLGTWFSEKTLFEIIHQFEAIRLRYFHTLCETKRKEFLTRNDKLFKLKLLTSSSLILTFCMRILIFNINLSWQFVILLIYFAILESLSIFKMNFFFCGMCYTNCIIRYIDEELMKYRRKFDFFEINQLCKIYMDVCQIVKALTRTFQWGLLSISLSAMVALVSLFFNFIVWWQQQQYQEIFLYGFLIVGLQCAIMNIADILLIAFICSNTLKCAINIQATLLMLSVRPHIWHHYKLQCKLNFLSLQVALNLPTVNVCGFFNMDLGTAFNLLEATLMYLIILIQFDYKDL